MRIGIDYSAAVNQTAGIGRYTRGLVSALARIDRYNQYVLFYTYSGRSKPEPFFGTYPNFQEKPLGLSPRTMALLWHRLHLPIPIELMIGPVDIFHSPDFVLPPVRRGSKVLTIHDLSFLIHPECAEEGLRDYLERAVPASAARANLVLADSAHTRNDVICLLDVPPEKTEVVYAGVEEKFRPIDDPLALAEVARQYQLQQPFILSVGTIEPRKNYSRLLEAYARLKAKSDVQLVIAGRPGWLYDHVYRRVHALKLGDRVRFLGHVQETNLPALYTLSKLFVFPSLYEGFGLPPVEAMACGTPVVASNTSSLPEVLGDAALLVSPTDVDELATAMERVLTDEELRSALVSKGRQRAGMFTWEKAAEKLHALYLRVHHGG